MINSKFLLLLFFILYIDLIAQTIVPPGDVSGTWSITGSPYEIQGEISIPFLDILTIEPGVLVEFQGHYKLNVYGRLLAVGTEADTITFTINDTTGFHNPNIPDGGWAGIRFTNVYSLYDTSKITFCKIEYGKAIGSWPDNSGGAICVDGFDALTISNCLITNNIASLSDGGGGGIALWNSNPEISNNKISNNMARFGGGIQCFESSPFIKNNSIFYNSAEAGGGIVCNEYSNPHILNTIIENNNASSGGGIVCWSYSSLTLVDVTFKDNSASIWGGGGVYAVNSELQIDHCTFIDNNINGIGGAIFLSCGDTLGIIYQSNITNTVFTNNTGNTGYAGGGIWANGFDSSNVYVVIDRCEFTSNVADAYGGMQLYGKKLNFTLTNSVITDNEAMYSGAGAGFIGECRGTVSNCLFASNNAGTGVSDNAGGVVIHSGANVDFMNCTFAGNSASYGAGLTVGGGGTATTTNCIFWGNSADQIALDTLNGTGGTLTVNYCDIAGGQNAVNVIDPLISTLNWGDANIDANPNFVDPLSSDYYLQDSSPCIGAAIDSMIINGIMFYCPTTDIVGNPRPNPSGTMPDMGAYESLFGTPQSVENSLLRIPNEWVLEQNYPNPFNPTTKINYSIPKSGFVSLKVYNILGREVATLVNEQKRTGKYEVKFDASNLPSGIYIYRLKAGTFVSKKKMILLK